MNHFFYIDLYFLYRILNEILIITNNSAYYLRFYFDENPIKNYWKKFHGDLNIIGYFYRIH